MFQVRLNNGQGEFGTPSLEQVKALLNAKFACGVHLKPYQKPRPNFKNQNKKWHIWNKTAWEGAKIQVVLGEIEEIPDVSLETTN